MNLSASEQKVIDILKEVKQRAQKTKGPIDDKEFGMIVRDMTQTGRNG